jgi:phosphatidylglycerol:prolipoprotein diacylglycerol transferase
MIRNAEWFLNLWRKRLGFLGEANRAPLPGIGHLADITAPALLIAMAIGRLGDVINGEHCSLATRLPWGLIYTHPDSPGGWPVTAGGCGGFAAHPAVVYELLFDLALLGIIWPMRHRLRPQGMTFALYGTLYSIGRFFISFLRVEVNSYWIFNEAQLIALAVVFITVPLLVYKAQMVRVVRPGGGAS